MALNQTKCIATDVCPKRSRADKKATLPDWLRGKPTLDQSLLKQLAGSHTQKGKEKKTARRKANNTAEGVGPRKGTG